MAFSIFSKKGSEPPQPSKAEPAKPGSKTPAPSRSAPPQPKPAALAPAVMSSKINEIEAEMDDLDCAAFAAQPAVSMTQAAKASPALTSLGISSVMMRELALSPFESAPVLEQAALLYAERNTAEARTALEAALKAGNMPQAAAHQAWLLLFDLLENLGEAEVFEAAAIDFAVAFETSPPAFCDRSRTNDPALDTGGGQYYAMNGALDAAVAPQLARLAEIALHSKIMRIEFGKITSVAAPGCTLLLERLHAFKKSGIDLVFSGIGHLAGVLGGAIETGRRTDPEVFWLLLLELQQFQGQQDVFEETALNYCITYEVSPPQWAAPAYLAKNSAPKSAGAGSTASGAMLPQDALYLKGTLQSSADARFAAINGYAASRKLVVLDMFDLRRVDPAAASEFINVLSALYGQNKELELRSPSPLIATLLISMGFTEQARFTLRAA